MHVVIPDSGACLLGVLYYPDISVPSQYHKLYVDEDILVYTNVSLVILFVLMLLH